MDTETPETIVADPRARRFARRLNFLAQRYQLSPATSLADAWAIVALDKWHAGEMQGSADELAFAFAWAMTGLLGRLQTEHILQFAALVAKHMLAIRGLNPKLLTSVGGAA